MSFQDKKRFADALSPDQIAEFTPWNIVQSAGKLYMGEAIQILAITDNQFEAIVHSNKQQFHTNVELAGGVLWASCDCAPGKRADLCKHALAAVMAVSEQLSKEIKNSWENKLTFVYTPWQQKKKSSITPEYLLVFALYSDYYGWKIKPLTARVSKLPGANKSPGERWTNEELIEFVAKNPIAQGQFHAKITHSLDAESCLNAPAHIVSLAKILMDLSVDERYYSGAASTKPIPAALEILRAESVPLYLGEYHYQQTAIFRQAYPLTISKEAANILLDIESQKDGSLRLQFLLYLGDKIWKLKKKPTLIFNSPLWLLLDDQLVPADESIDAWQINNLQQAMRVTVPADEKDKFSAEYLPRLAERFTITGTGVQVCNVTDKPQPRLYLEDNQGKLEVWLRFGYGEYEIPYASRIPETTPFYDQDTATFTRIFRDEEQERAAFTSTSDFGLKRVTGNPGLFNLRSRVDAIDFLLRYVPKAAASGFEVYGEEQIKNIRVNRNVPRISFHIASGIDWFDLQVSVQYGDQQVTLNEVRRALKRSEHYVKLADGTIGEIPEEWLERYKHLFGLGEETEQGLRFSSQQATLLDQLLGESDQAVVDDEFRRRLRDLSEFHGVTAQPLPKGVDGELRPYQKFGLDWLHFLHHYGFGGCLADDMGLGKTLQVLAFLQSLKEQGASRAAALVVVPRSLLVNWQREAEKFTPELSILEYHGQLREKDPAVFDQFDLALTTYGVVVKDFELLRKYRFHYVILDESQAIKNPVSQSAKACRLLQADHRLVMTGTPVENSTFELWSQFAFLNPGFLGSLEYFKSEIGGPIEKDGNTDTAQFLRRLVYPFILRRTKEQVAPELPPRTERVIYGEMDSAQRKLYLRTRENYRKELLGLITDQGLDNARMKILEGLLRLRQICIHPRLVDSTYHGASAKFELLLETVETLAAEGHKALIYSQFVESLKLLRAELDNRRLRYTYLDGQTENRQARVDQFQNDPTFPLFLISLKAGGVGLNLTAADYVIHLDPWWNPAVEMQASDRAHRIGQDKPVFVYKYILRDTVEEKILQLQDHKRRLVDQLITTETSFFKSITREDVHSLFS